MIIDLDPSLYAHPERLSPSYCWENWPPVHSGTCRCGKAADDCPAPDLCVRGPDPHQWSTDCEMDEGWADL